MFKTSPYMALVLVPVWGCALSHLPAEDAGADAPTVDAAVDAADVALLDETPTLEIATGVAHTCVRRASGRAYCWGNNVARVLGRVAPSFFDAVPGPVDTLDNVSSIDAEQYLSCAVREGAVWCWGEDIVDLAAPSEELGSRRTRVMPPTRIEGIADAVDVSTGRGFGCAISRDGGVLCFGNNRRGQLGDGTQIGHVTGQPVAGLRDVVELALGETHSCARTRDGIVWCWGLGGHIWPDESPEHLTPTRIVGVENAGSIASGWYYSCATRLDGAVLCWGDHPASESFYSSEFETPFEPERVADVSDAVQICGSRFVCALRTDGSVWCWGPNEGGQLGNGALSDRESPAQVVGLGVATEIACTWSHACALVDGDVYCWGDNTSGQLGTRDTTARLVPTRVQLP